MEARIAISEVVLSFGVKDSGVESSIIRIKLDNEGAGNYLKISNDIKNSEGLILDWEELAIIRNIGLLLCKTMNDVIEPETKVEDFIIAIEKLLKRKEKGGEE